MISSLSRWALCFMVVEFDVDIGPDLKLMRPSIKFTESDFRVICFSALPERTANEVKAWECQFHTFRFPSSTFNIPLYGNVLFSTIPSTTSSRGYIQQSLVVLSPHCFPRLFSNVISLITTSGACQSGQDFITASAQEKVVFLDNAIANITHWPNPDKRVRLDLPFLGQIFTVVGSDDSDNGQQEHEHEKGVLQHLEDPFGSWQMLLPHLRQPGTILNFGGLLPTQPLEADLYLIYEHLVLGLPMVVFSLDPHLCSMFINNCVDLIRPMVYSSKVYEYVTVHTCPDTFPQGGLYGVTNPLLAKSDGSFLLIDLTTHDTAYHVQDNRTITAKPSLSKLLNFRPPQLQLQLHREGSIHKGTHRRLLSPQKIDLSSDEAIRSHFHRMSQLLKDLLSMDPDTAQPHVPTHLKGLYDKLRS